MKSCFVAKTAMLSRVSIHEHRVTVSGVVRLVSAVRFQTIIMRYEEVCENACRMTWNGNVYSYRAFNLQIPIQCQQSLMDEEKPLNPDT